MSDIAAPCIVPFNYLEDAVAIQDAPDHPMAIHLELQVEGRLDADRLRSALKQAAARHPMARAKVLPAADTDRSWQFEIERDYSIDPVSEREYGSELEIDADRDALFNVPVPMDASPPFRVLLAHRAGGGDRLIVNFHHVAGDAIGAVRLLRSIQRAYAGGSDLDPLIEFQAARDLHGLLGISDPEERQRRAEPRWRYLEELERDAPARLVPQGADPAGGQGIVHLALTADEVREICARRRGGATLNDVLIAAHHLTYQEWNQRRGEDAGRIGTMMAMNSRPQAWRYDVLGNYTIGGVVTTRPHERTTFEATLRAVAVWTGDYKRTQAGAIAVELEAFGRQPVGVKRAMGAQFPEAFWEGVLSNLGLLDDFGSFGDGGSVAQLWFTPPVVVQGIAIGAVGLGERLFIGGRYRRAVFSTQAAQQFLHLYREVLLHAR